MREKAAVKTGISANVRDLWGDECFGKLKGYGFDCLDYNLANTKKEPYTLSNEDFPAFLAKERALADAAGITIWQVHGPWEGAHTDATPDGLEERMEKMTRSIHGAKILGAKYWVIHPIMPHGACDLDSGRASETRKANVDFFTRLTEVARAEGITICLENMPFPRFSISTPDDVMDIVNKINDDHFKMCLDTGHANIFSDHAPSKSLRKWREHIKVLHVHDNMGNRDDHRLPYYGTVDWEDFKSALKEVGFDGVLSLECAPRKALPPHVFDAAYKLYADLAKFLAE